MALDRASKLVWMITGTSQGFGRDLVAAALERGDSVVATSRDPGKVTAQFPKAGERLMVTAMDLRDEAQVQSTVASAVKKFGKIDVLVNNAGYGMLGAVEEIGEEETRKVFEVNVFGLLRVTRAVVAHMRARRSGHIVNLSSIGGLVGLPGWGIYNATKFAVEGISEALALEVKPLGIGVTVVEPGPFRTDFLGGSLSMAQKQIAAYDATAGQTRKYQAENNAKQPGDPVRAAQAIVEAVTASEPPLHLLLGALAYQRANAKLDAMRGEFEKWKGLTLGADFPK